MNKSDITFRKVVVAAGGGLIGVIVGGMFVKWAVPKFFGSSPWLFPAVVVGILAAFVTAALIALAIVGDRRRAKH